LAWPDHFGGGFDDRPEGAVGAFVVDAARIVAALFFQHAQPDKPAELVSQV
jgi:hypothetical protein